MSKLLILCEGPNELAIINLLLDNNKLKFTRDDLLDLRPFHARQLTSPIIIPILNQYHGDIIIYRIGDKMNDKLKINKEYKEFIKGQYKFCTKPKLEILLIIVENKLNAFEKMKSKIRPKEFCKKYVSFNNQKYDNSTQFFIDYFTNRIDLLIYSIKEYHRTHKKHESDEGYIYDLLK